MTRNPMPDRETGLAFLIIEKYMLLYLNQTEKIFRLRA